MRRFLFLALLVASCGSPDCPDAAPLPAEYLPRYEELQECSGVRREPPLLATPLGEACVAFGRETWCARPGQAHYSPECETVVIPSQRLDPSDLFDDEALHHLACRVEGDCDADHSWFAFSGSDRGGCL